VPLLPALYNRRAFRQSLGIAGRVGTTTHRHALPVSAVQRAQARGGSGELVRGVQRQPQREQTYLPANRIASFFEFAHTLCPFAHRSTPLVAVFTQVSIK
jgi:hypothetical protein